MRSQDIHIKFSQELVEKIDRAAADNFQTRSAYIRQAITLRLNGQYVTKAQQEENDFDSMLLQFLPADHPAAQKRPGV